MDWLPYVPGLLGTVVGLGGLYVSLRKQRRDEADGVTEQETVMRRDTIADRDAFIDQYQEDMMQLRARLSAIEREYEIERDWNRMLVDHIFRGKPPPPPARPTR